MTFWAFKGAGRGAGCGFTSSPSDTPSLSVSMFVGSVPISFSLLSGRPSPSVSELRGFVGCLAFRGGGGAEAGETAAGFTAGLTAATEGLTVAATAGAAVAAAIGAGGSAIVAAEVSAIAGGAGGRSLTLPDPILAFMSSYAAGCRKPFMASSLEALSLAAKKSLFIF